jgi:hypothetical protein
MWAINRLKVTVLQDMFQLKSTNFYDDKGSEDSLFRLFRGPFYEAANILTA